MATDRSICLKVLDQLYETGYREIYSRCMIERPYVVVCIRLETKFGLAVGIGMAKCGGGDEFGLSAGYRIAKIRAFRAIADDYKMRLIVLQLAADIGG